MTEQSDSLFRFYSEHLHNTVLDGTVLTADCPFCRERGLEPDKRFVAFLNKAGFFYGYFRCLNRCVSGGYPLWFARLAGVDLSDVDGYDPERELFLQRVDYPSANINHEIKDYQERLTEDQLQHFKQAGVGAGVLKELRIGFNGRYLVYPYIQDDGNCYSARCIHPDKKEDFFWHGDEAFFGDSQTIFNVQDIQRCENGTLFICEGEENLLTLKQLGFPGIAVPQGHILDTIDSGRFAWLHTIFIVMNNSAESEATARGLAARIGYKVRLFNWPAGTERNYNLYQLAIDQGKNFRQAVSVKINKSRAFSPFPSPIRENNRFFEQMAMETGSSYKALRSGFPRFDAALGGVHGINVIGGAPKAGKSCFMIQIATEMAYKGIPVLYYDFENGRQKIYQRTLARKSRISLERIKENILSGETLADYNDVCDQFKEMLNFFRVINDRAITPEIMRRHIDFIRHETRSDYTVVIIDSLHKLPFKDFSERRTGIDAWLRQLESIRDELQVAFLVISELSRDSGGAYSETPHLGVFKGSGDIEYSADNALVLYPDWNPMQPVAEQNRENKLWLVASREHPPGLVGRYLLDYPYWGFVEQQHNK